MEPKEKALDLITIYYSQLSGAPKILVGSLPLSDDSHWKEAKLCALICINEIIEIVSSDDSAIIVELQYWQEVKSEIEKL